VGVQVLEAYPDGVWLVELAPLSHPDLLAETVTSALEIVRPSTHTGDTQLLINFLRPKEALLILDNCEHLLEASAALADTLLKRCPQLKLLVTSREALGILGEIVYPMPSLGIPDARQMLETFRDYESVRLLEARAQLARPNFKLTFGDAWSVAQICARLDGMPLAIELAAARVSMLSTAQIAARLDDRFNLFTGGSRTVLPRQQTLRASIDWSWNLLSGPERTLLRRLAVFAGGWTLEAAEAVCSPQGELEAQPVFELLTQLVTKSLVIADRQPGPGQRFQLHETIHQCAREKLVDAGEHDQLRHQHLTYVLNLSALAEPALRGPHQREWYRRLDDERDNLRVALDYASTADVEAGLALSARLIDYWVFSDLREGLRWSTKLIQCPKAHSFPLARARALTAQGYLLWHMQQFDAVRSIAEECLAVFRSSGDQQGEYDGLILMENVSQFAAGMEQRAAFHRQALALGRSMGDSLRQAYALSMLGRDQRDPQRSREQLEEAITLFRPAGDWRFLAQTLGILGCTVLLEGDLEAAQKYLDEADEANQHIENSEMEYVLPGKGLLCMQRGDYGQARAFLQRNIDDLDRMGKRIRHLWARARLGAVALREGSWPEAQQILIETIENFHADHNLSGLVFALDRMASLWVMIDRPEAAARLIGWSDANREKIGDRRPRIGQADLDWGIATIHATLGVEAYETAYNSGRGLTFDEAVALALVT
jgi:predicted ATPase